MLLPEFLQKITEKSEEIASNLHTIIINKIVSAILHRLDRKDEYLITAKDKYQMQVLEDAGYLRTEIQQEIANKAHIRETALKEAMVDAGITTINAENKIYEQAGMETTGFLKDPYLQDVMTRNYKATSGEMRNMCKTTAVDATNMFINQMDNAYNMVMSGAQSYTGAVNDIINNTINEGIKITYPSGRKLTIEAATMMVVRTGVSQGAAEIDLAKMEQMNWDTILVSSHLGARTGDGGNNAGNHSWWQGKFYSRTGKDKRYPDFKSITGYGTLLGLCGANCRHSFGAGDGENNPFETYDTAENKQKYDDQQRQRLLERRIRDTKRKVKNLQTAVKQTKNDKIGFELQQTLDRKSALLQKQNKAYKQYCAEKGLKEYSERLKISGWGRAQATKASAAARRYNARGNKK